MRSVDRVKSLGEVFTPRRVVLEMLHHVSNEIWSDPSKTFCDPAGCGNGNFLVAVVRRKIEAGSTPLQALRTTYGVDIMQDNVDECRRRLIEQAQESSGQTWTWGWLATVTSNIVCHDALTYDFLFNPVFVSPKEDHELAHQYGLYLVSKGKRYENAHGGARLELAAGRWFENGAYERCVEHLQRAIAGRETEGDWHYDSVINGTKIDYKAAELLVSGEPANLILDESKPKSDIAYVLAEHDKLFPTQDTKPYCMRFKLRGWTFGEKDSFVSAPWAGQQKIVAKLLNDWESFMKIMSL